MTELRVPAGAPALKPGSGWLMRIAVMPVDVAGLQRPGLVSHRRAGRGARPSRAAPGGTSSEHPAPGNEETVRNYRGLVKRLDLPAGWVPPAKLEYDDIRARAISRADNDDDVQGINASIELIRRTRGGSWPAGPVSADFNYVDVVWHEC